MALEDRVADALSSLLPRHTGEITEDVLFDAFNVSVDRRERNTRDGGAVVEALQQWFGQSNRSIANRNGRISKSSVDRWAKPPAR